MKPISLRVSSVLFLCLFPVTICYGQQNGQRLPVEISPQTTPSVEVQAFLGTWGSRDASKPFMSYELRDNGTCDAKTYLMEVGSYVHDGDLIKIPSAAPGQSELVWRAQIEGDHLTLEFSEDSPACPFHRIEGEGSASDSLVGTWAAEKCGGEDWKPASVKLRMRISNALYTFSDNHIVFMRSRLEDVQPYTIKEDTIYCPVFGMPKQALRLTSQDGVPTLLSLGASRSYAYVRFSPGDIALRQYIPGDISKANADLERNAYDYFKSELATDPSDVTALDKLGLLLYQMAGNPFDRSKFEESQTYYRRHISLRPNDADPHYIVGAIDWALTYRGNREMRAEYNKAHLNKQVQDTEPLPHDVRIAYTQKYRNVVDDGIKAFQTAIQLEPDYNDARIYLNLLFRCKGDMAESAAERNALTKQADELLAKAMSIRQANVTADNARQSKYPPIPAPPPPPVPRVAVGGAVQAARLVNRVPPVYPPLARQTRIQGTVRLHAIIDTDGTVQELTVMDGHPLLIQAAIDAVKQWRYQPTVVNGRPGEVDTEIDVLFSLAQ